MHFFRHAGLARSAKRLRGVIRHPEGLGKTGFRLSPE
jgi:hypothetical protein